MTALIVYEKLGGFRGSVTDPGRTIEPSRATSPSSPANRFPSTPCSTLSSSNLPTTPRAPSDAHVAGSTRGLRQHDESKSASRIGCFNTHFYNPNGLPAPSGTHFTSCADLMKIFRQVLKYPELAKIMSTREYRDSSTASGHPSSCAITTAFSAIIPAWAPRRPVGPSPRATPTPARCTQEWTQPSCSRMLDSPNKWAGLPNPLQLGLLRNRRSIRTTRRLARGPQRPKRRRPLITVAFR